MSTQIESLPHSFLVFCTKRGMPENLSVEGQFDWITKQIEDLSRIATILQKQVTSLQDQIDSDYWPLA